MEKLVLKDGPSTENNQFVTFSNSVISNSCITINLGEPSDKDIPVDKVSKSVQTEVQTLSDDQSIPQTAQASTEDTEDNPWIFGIYQRVQEAELKGTERTQSPEEEESNMDAMDNQDTFRSDQSPSYTSQIATSHNTTLRSLGTSALRLSHPKSGEPPALGQDHPKSGEPSALEQDHSKSGEPSALEQDHSKSGEPSALGQDHSKSGEPSALGQDHSKLGEPSALGQDHSKSREPSALGQDHSKSGELVANESKDIYSSEGVTGPQSQPIETTRKAEREASNNLIGISEAAKNGGQIQLHTVPSPTKSKQSYSEATEPVVLGNSKRYEPVEGGLDSSRRDEPVESVLGNSRTVYQSQSAPTDSGLGSSLQSPPVARTQSCTTSNAVPLSTLTLWMACKQIKYSDFSRVRNYLVLSDEDDTKIDQEHEGAPKMFVMLQCFMDKCKREKKNFVNELDKTLKMKAKIPTKRLVSCFQKSESEILSEEREKLRKVKGIQKLKLEDEPDSGFIQTVADTYAADWKMLGRLLGLDEDTIRRISTDIKEYQTTYDCCLGAAKVLNAFKDKFLSSPNCSKETIVTALVILGKEVEDVVQKLNLFDREGTSYCGPL